MGRARAARRTFEKTEETRGEVLGLLDELRRRMERKDHQLSPRRVLRRLQALSQDRFVLPGAWPVLPPEDVSAEMPPLPMREDHWRTLAFTSVYDLGVTCPTGSALRYLDITTVAALLLRSERELITQLAATGTDRECRNIMRDVRNVLNANGLRMATCAEWQTALDQDFCRVLKGYDDTELRVATFMLPELPMSELRALFDEYTLWPYEWEGLVVLRQIQALTPGQLEELWERCGKRYAEADWTYEMDSSVCKTGARLAQQGVEAMTSFLERNDLTLKVKPD